jgi:lantibiotic modifying enzyme
MPSEGDQFLDVAADLGLRIADSAIWYGGRANWIGMLPGDESLPSANLGVHGALGPDLYSGTSGIALFLAEAAARLGDRRLRATALGAIRHGLDHADQIEPESRDGLYAGSIGIAYSAARVGQLLDDEVPLAGGCALLAAWQRDHVAAPASDMASGCAGGIAGLVALAELLDDACLVEVATRLAEDLIGRAEISPAGWSWPAPRRRSMHNLCGFAHGAAGVGHALLELGGVTGDDRFREAGEGAFDYEWSWFQHRSATWPDLRGVGRRAGRDVPLPAAGSWCHGVPGIALSRLRAARLTGRSVDRADADIGLAATEQLVSEFLARGWDDFSLCHGATGAADVLLYGADSSGLAAEVGLSGIECHHRSGTSFPCGLRQGDTPGLFLGLAGIGLFYLRLGDPAVPTPLVIHRRDALDKGAGTALQSDMQRSHVRDRAPWTSSRIQS